MPKKPNKQDNLRRQDIERAHAARHSGLTMDQLGEAMLQTVRRMSPDQKAILRARMLRSVGLIKSSEGKSS